MNGTDQICHTTVGVLSRNLGNCISNLLPDICSRLTCQASHQLLADNQPLLASKRREEFLGLIGSGIFPRLGCYSSEKYCGECTCL